MSSANESLESLGRSREVGEGYWYRKGVAPKFSSVRSIYDNESVGKYAKPGPYSRAL